MSKTSAKQFDRNSGRLARHLMATTALVAILVAAPAHGQDTLITGADFSNTNSAAIDVSLATGDITVAVGNVTTTGDDAPGLDLTTLDGRILAEIEGRVQTDGDNSTGIVAHASGDVLIGVGESIITSGDYADGLVATSSTGDITVVVSGGVLTSGQSAVAASLLASEGDISFTADHISTLGNGASGIDLTALDGTAYASVGSITTAGDFATAASIAGDQVYFFAYQSISTAGDYSTGIAAQGGNIVLEFADISTTGDFSPAVSAGVDGGALSITGGRVQTTGDHSPALDLYARDGSISIVLESVETTGFDSSGLDIRAFNSSVLAIINSINAYGDATDAAFKLLSDGGRIGVEIGDIATLGYGVSGIDVTVTPTISSPLIQAQEVGAAAAGRHEDIIISAGSILTAGDEAFGILLSIDDVAGAATSSGLISIVADMITTEGEGADAIRFIDTAGNGNASIAVGDLITSGDRSYGLVASAGSSTLNVVAGGTVETLGDSSDGIRLVSNGDINLHANNVLTLGYSAEGIHITNRVSGDDSRFVNVTANSVLTSGRYASGIKVATSAAHIDVTATDVTTFGNQAHGIRVTSDAGDINVRSSGHIQTSGSFADGISSWSDTGRIDLLVTDVTVTGERSMGVAANTDEGGDIEIVGLGDIHASGLNSNAVAAFAWSAALGETDYSYGDVTINLFGQVVAAGEVNLANPDWPVYGNGVVVHANTSNVTIGEDAHLESANGYAFISVDIAENLGSRNPLREARDRLSIFGSIAGDVSFGRGDDSFAIFQGADISRLGFSDGGSGQDLLQLNGWEGSLDATDFAGFEELSIADGAAVRLGGNWQFDTIDLADSHLLLSNGAVLNGFVSVLDFDRRSVISFFDAGASSSRLVGDVFALDGVGLNLVDGAGDDSGTITGQLDGTAFVFLDVGIGNGQITTADSLNLGGVSDDVVLYLNPYSATGAGIAGPLLTIADGSGEIVLAGGPMSWGGQIFDLSVDGAGASQSSKSLLSAAGGSTSQVSLISTGFTAQGAGTVALPAILDALDASLYTNRASRRGRVSGGAPQAIWGDARFDNLEGSIDGINYDGEQSSISLGADFGEETGWNASLMLRSATSQTDLVQDLAGTSRVDVDTLAFGAAVGWNSAENNHYAEITLWATERDIALAGSDLSVDGVITAFETGTLFSVGQRTQVQPLAQLVWTQAQTDVFTETVSGGDMKSGDNQSLRVRSGAVVTHSLSETWTVEATMIADFNGRDSGRTFLASGYDEAAALGGMGGELGLRISGQMGDWALFGDVSGRTAGGRDGADGLGAGIGISRRF